MTIAADKEKPSWAGRALQWWLGELAGMMGDVQRRLDLGRRGAIFVEAGERYWLVRRNGRPLGQIDRALLSDDETARALARIVGTPRRGPVIAEIPQDRMLMKRVALPAAAEGTLERVLHYEIGRHFPFPAERVHFRHRVVGPPGGFDGTVTVEIVAVARETVAEIVATLRAAGLAPRSLALACGAQGPLYLPIAGEAKRMQRLERVLAGTLALLIAAALASPIVRDRLALMRLHQELAEIEPQARAVLAAREAERRDRARASAPLRLAHDRPPLIAILAGLTQAVPDGSWLLSLSLSGRELVIDGLSPSAAGVALALEASHRFADVTFRSPITRDPQSGLERFELSASLPEHAP